LAGARRLLAVERGKRRISASQHEFGTIAHCHCIQALSSLRIINLRDGLNFTAVGCEYSG